MVLQRSGGEQREEATSKAAVATAAEAKVEENGATSRGTCVRTLLTSEYDHDDQDDDDDHDEETKKEEEIEEERKKGYVV